MKSIKVYLNRKVQIITLIADKVSFTVLAEYSNFEDIFSKKSAAVLPEHTEINTYTINLEKGKQPLYRPIYRLRLVKLKILKTYIKTNLAKSFICLFKSPTSTPFLFNKKPNRNL